MVLFHPAPDIISASHDLPGDVGQMEENERVECHLHGNDMMRDLV